MNSRKVYPYDSTTRTTPQRESSGGVIARINRFFNLKQKELENAVINNDVATVQRLVRNKYVSKEQKSLLLMASDLGEREEIVRVLIAVGSNINAANHIRKTALMFAAQRGNTTTARDLIAAGANVNAVSSLGDTALIYAAENGHTLIAQALIDAGADINALNSRQGNTALMYAAVEGHLQATQTLIAAGADVNAANPYDGFTALMLAAQNGHTKTALALIAAGANVNATNSTLTTASMWAACNGNITILQALIAAGADVNASNSPRGDTALILAAQNGHIEASQTLIIAGVANVDAVNSFGGSALIYATESRHAAIVSMIQALRQDDNTANSFGNRSLILAAQNGRAETVRAMILGGADVNLVVLNGLTSLTIADRYHHTTTVQALIAGGATNSTNINLNPYKDEIWKKWEKICNSTGETEGEPKIISKLREIRNDIKSSGLSTVDTNYVILDLLTDGKLGKIFEGFLRLGKENQFLVSKVNSYNEHTFPFLEKAKSDISLNRIYSKFKSHFIEKVAAHGGAGGDVITHASEITLFEMDNESEEERKGEERQQDFKIVRQSVSDQPLGRVSMRSASQLQLCNWTKTF